MSLSVPLEPSSKEILHISAHYLVILVIYSAYIYSIQFSSIQGLFRVKIRKMVQGSDDLPTLPLNSGSVLTERMCGGRYC